MTPEELRRDEAGRWLVQAGRDLNGAQLLAGPEPSLSVFHSQQAAEKERQGLSGPSRYRLRKTHNLDELVGQCAAVNPLFDLLRHEAAALTNYAVIFRYLGAPHEPDEQEAVAAMELAARIFKKVSALLL